MKTNFLVNSNLFPLIKDDFLTFMSDSLIDFWPDHLDVKSDFKLLSEKGYPKVNVKLYENEYVIDATVPGMDKEDLKVEIDEVNSDELILRIKGSKKIEKCDKIVQKEFCHEIKQSNFVRSFILPNNVKFDKIETKLDKGILKIIIPIIEHKKEKKRITNIEIK